MKLEPYLSDEIIPDLNNIVRDIEDEGDRCYFGSTNDADRLREIADWLEANFRRTPPASQSNNIPMSGTEEALVDTGDRSPPASSTDEELLEELARAGFEVEPRPPGLEPLFGWEVQKVQNGPNWLPFRRARAILPILHRVRREGIEEAAKVAERSVFNHRNCLDAARDIRALAEKQP